MGAEEYWKLTPAEVFYLVDAHRKRQEEEAWQDHKRQCLYAGIVAADVVNALVGKHVRDPQDYVPMTREERTMTPEEAEAVFRAWAQTVNAQMKR